MKWIPQFGPGHDPRGMFVKTVEIKEHIDANRCLTKSLVFSCGHEAIVNPIYQYEIGTRQHCLKCLEVLREKSTIEVSDTAGMR